MDIVTLGQAKAAIARQIGSSAGPGWSVVSSKAASHLQMNSAFSSTYAQTSRIAQVATTDVEAVRVGYHNWFPNGTGTATGSGEFPFPQGIAIRAELQLVPPGAALSESNAFNPVVPLTFGGAERVVVRGGKMVLSDPASVHIAAGMTYFIKTYVIGSTIPAPAAATVTPATSGGSLAAGTYNVSLTYVYPDGVESSASTSASAVVASGTTGTVVVTSPASVAGALGYRVYGALNTSSTQQATDSGTVPFGVNYTWTQSAITATSVARDCVIGGQIPTYPSGIPVLGGTASTNSANTGEGSATNADRTGEGLAIFPGTVSSVFAPSVVLGLTPKRIMPSLGIIGDSINAGSNDYGFAGSTWGGFAVRAVLGQPTNRVYDITKLPLMGHVWVAVAGDLASAFAGTQGTRRTQMASLCTTILCDYGTNDLVSNQTATATLSSLLTIAARFTSLGKRFIQTTILPKAAVSTDGWRTVTNQSVLSATAEGHRRQLNALLVKPGGQSTVTNEAMFGGYASTQGSAVNFYGGGNGAATSFLTRQVFVQGSETVKVNGTTKALTTDYTYVGAVTIGSTAYASGVTFTAAPANSATVTASYTAAAGFTTLAGPLTRVIDTAAAVEVDTAGTAGTGGGWWKPDTSTARDTGTVTAISTSTLTDSTKAWTTNQHRGYTMRIVSDPTTPTSVGQVRVIAFNTATVLTTVGGWNVTPSTSATYEIADAYTSDGVHPTTRGHITVSPLIDLSLVV